MARPEYEALYGGAAGGGKTQALVAEALRQVHIPHYRAIIFRKTYKELLEIRDIAMDVYGRAFPRAKYNGSEHCWTFPSGARVYFGNMQYTSDRAKYQGQAYDYVGFDELTHFLADEYMYMYSRCRPHGPGTRCYVRAATNPGGVGHGWVKERFIAPAPPMTTVRYDAEVVAPDGKKLVIPRTRVFVPSTVFDNQKLLDNSPEYLANLAMLPEAERQALLYGSWDSFSGQVFIEWRDDPAHYVDKKYTHVIAPFDEIPPHWRIYRGFDFGYSKPYSVGWYAADPDGRIYRILELYGCTGSPNTGTQEHPGEIARRIRTMEGEHPYLRGRRIIGIADPAIFDESRGESVAEMMARAPNLVLFDKADNTRIAGKMQMHYRMAFREDGRPMFQVFSTCRHFIRTVPALVYDQHTVEDIDTDGEDHCLASDTLVRTDAGWVRIDEMPKTGHVLSHDGQMHAYEGHRMTVERATVYEIEMDDGTRIRATRNHRFMLADGTWKRLDQLMEGDALMQNAVAISSTAQEYKGVLYYKCGHYFQRKGVRLHRLVWEDAHGPVPAGHAVHHVDGNKANNALSNLALMKTDEHMKKHAHDPGRLEWQRMNAERIRPLAKAWHASEEGRAWHSMHAKEIASKTALRPCVCTQCGREFTTKYTFHGPHNRFCSGKCKAKHLRDQRKLERATVACV